MNDLSVNRANKKVEVETTHVLFLSLDGMTDPLGQSQVLPYVIGLTKKGYRFSIISLEKEGHLKKRKAIIKALIADHPINWFPLKYGSAVPLVSNFVNMRKMTREGKRICRKDPVQLLHCRGYFAGLVGLSLRKKFGCKYLFDMRGFWPDERVDGNLWPQTNPVFKSLYTFFKRKEKEYLEIADHTVSLTHNAKEEILGWKHIDNNPVPITVIPCCADTDHFDPAKVEAERIQTLRKELDISSDQFVLLYLGGVGTWYLLEEMLGFFKRLKLQKPESLFLFVTADPPIFIYQKARESGIAPDALRIVQSERKDVPSFIALSHLSIFFIKPSYSKKASSPTKQAELMSMGIPVICNSGVGDTDFVVENYDSGHLVHSFDDRAYDEAVATIPALLKISKQGMRNGALDYFSLIKGVELYAGVYEKALQ